MSNKQTKIYSFKDILVNLLNAEENYLNDYIGTIKGNNLDGRLLISEDAAALDAFEKLYRENGSIPTKDLFQSYYPDYCICQLKSGPPSRLKSGPLFDRDIH